jgi:predicted nucleotidyltransferase
MVAQQCKSRHRVFTGSAFPDFYTSKLLKRGTWDMYHTAAEAAKAGIKKTERKYIATGLSYNFRQQLAFGIEQQVPIMNIITWNDYPEGHHLAPEVNHNDGFTILLKYFRSQWKGEPNPYSDTDVLVAFYKKYKNAVQPSPFNFSVVEIEKRGIALIAEDSIEVVSILKENAGLLVGGREKKVGAGLQVTRFASTAGPVIIKLIRNKIIADSLQCPEWITDQPYRTDRLTYSYSNLTKGFYASLFGKMTAIESTEYNPASTNKIKVYKK